MLPEAQLKRLEIERHLRICFRQQVSILLRAVFLYIYFFPRFFFFAIFIIHWNFYLMQALFYFFFNSKQEIIIKLFCDNQNNIKNLGKQI